jgi:thiol:disulfide interchange protein DsbD
MKNILAILLFIGSLFAADDFLSPDKAFKATVQKKENSIEFQIVLDKTIYLYDEFLKVKIKPDNIDITKELKLPIPVKYDGFIVHFGTVNISVPMDLIKSKIGEKDFDLILEYQGCSKKGLCYSPMEIIYKSKASVKTANTVKKEEQATPNLFAKKEETVLVAPNVEKPLNETDTITQTLKDGNVAIVLLTFFGFGLLLALTPCIFPMIPILSSIIVQHTKDNGGELSASKGFMLSLVYVLSMSAAYTIAGVLAGVFGANIQAMLQNPFVIVAFVAIFIALAFSMFGYYELSLPSSWQTKLSKTSDEQSKGNGVVGIAIMGFLSALIVGPCVAPPLAGALVYIGQTGDAVLGGLALFVMSLGMGVPLLAIGLGAGKYMPKPGGWMMVVSKVFGVVMLAVAIWMLDRIVPFIVTIGLVTALCLGSAYYLLKNGNKFGKVVAALLVVFSIVFMAKGLETKDDKLHYTYVKTVEQLEQIVKESKKPIMVDFWATWCVSCLELDNITFKDKAVQEELLKYTLIKVDVTKNTDDDKALMKKFNLFGPPALIFYKDGVEEKQKRIIGFKNPEEFLKIIK